MRMNKYQKYNKGRYTHFDIKNEIYEKLNDILDRSSSFVSINDILEYCVWDCQDEKGLKSYQHEKYRKRINDLKRKLKNTESRLKYQKIT